MRVSTFSFGESFSSFKNHQRAPRSSPAVSAKGGTSLFLMGGTESRPRKQNRSPAAHPLSWGRRRGSRLAGFWPPPGGALASARRGSRLCGSYAAPLHCSGLMRGSRKGDQDEEEGDVATCVARMAVIGDGRLELLLLLPEKSKSTTQTFLFPGILSLNCLKQYFPH